MSSFLIEDWMMSDGLKLKGCELFLYALIHSYTKAGKTMFESEQSLGERFGYSRRNVGRALESLRRRGLIIRRNKHPGRQSYDYCCDISSQPDATKVYTEVRQIVPAGRDKSSHDKKNDKYMDKLFNERKNETDRRMPKRCISDIPEQFTGHDTLKADKA